ncbi:hypothetical protein GWK47_010446 [Chionoecetes opilio]|uniref:Uncharacterized protein n=1 Tax=Chionoecetes opilio TaxID=41210 RepID=A0A8J4XYI8_CHIOP|nr:hypothetical protein GWK47_010446 [Chionoecetes opilio]
MAVKCESAALSYAASEWASRLVNSCRTAEVDFTRTTGHPEVRYLVECGLLQLAARINAWGLCLYRELSTHLQTVGRRYMCADVCSGGKRRGAAGSSKATEMRGLQYPGYYQPLPVAPKVCTHILSPWCGFIGRHIVCELVSKDVCASVCVVDKVPPQIAWLNEGQRKVFDHECVTFRSANLINTASCAAAFGDEEWDWVINAAGETKTGQLRRGLGGHVPTHEKPVPAQVPSHWPRLPCGVGAVFH